MIGKGKNSGDIMQEDFWAKGWAASLITLAVLVSIPALMIAIFT